jgi:hypothetical protein
MSPPPRRRVRNFCSCGEGMPASDAPVGRGWPLVRSCGVGKPARAAPAERGFPPELLLRGGDAWRRQSGGFWVLWKSGWSIEDCTCGRLMPPPRVTLLLGVGIHTGQANICQIFHMKTTLKLKINMLRAHLGLNIYLLNPSTGLPNLMRLRLSTPAKKYLKILKFTVIHVKSTVINIISTVIHIQVHCDL